MSTTESFVAPAAVSRNPAGWGRINQEAIRLDKARASLDYTKPWLWARWTCQVARLIDGCERLLSLGDDSESCAFVFAFLRRQLAPLQEAFVHLPELEGDDIPASTPSTAEVPESPPSYTEIPDVPDDARTVDSEGGSSLSPQLGPINHPALKRQISGSSTGSTRPKKAAKVSFTSVSASSSSEVPKVTKGKGKGRDRFDSKSLDVNRLLPLSHRDRQLAYENATRHIFEEFSSIVKAISRTERELGRIEGGEERREIIEISDDGS
ncbi:hypothetical protein JOM56_009974 [Amanita muscaria]